MSFEHYMHQALHEARQAQAQGEVPVGAVVIFNDEIIGRGSNSPIGLSDPTAHAEIIAIREAAKKIGNYRLLDTTLVVTLEPCVMCFNAMIHARIKQLVFGAHDSKAGANSVFGLFSSSQFNHQITWHGGVLAQECQQILSVFFKAKR